MTLILPGSGLDAELNAANKVRFYYDQATNEAGLQIRLTNKTGGNSIKGYLVEPSSTTARAFDYTPLGEPDIMGIVYEAGIADGSECWIWLAGCVEVYYIGTTTLEYLARMGIAADGGAAGQAVAEPMPGSPFSTDKHFQEVGHVVEAIGGAGLALTVLHFN